MFDPQSPYLSKAQESLDGAQSEYANGRRNNCANRCYYACFQAAIHAMMQAGLQPPGASGQWGHDYVQGEFVGQLINRRKLYPGEMRDTLARASMLRRVADYGRDAVSDTQAERMLSRAEQFVEAIQVGGRRG